MFRTKSVKRRWALPEGYSQKNVFFRHTPHGEKVRYTVCGIYNEVLNCLFIGVSRHDTEKFGQMCKADGRQRSFARALDSCISLRTLNQESALDLFKTTSHVFMHSNIAECTRTETEVLDAEARRREDINVMKAAAQRNRDARQFLHEQRMIMQKARSEEYKRKNGSETPVVTLPVKVEKMAAEG